MPLDGCQNELPLSTAACFRTFLTSAWLSRRSSCFSGAVIGATRSSLFLVVLVQQTSLQNPDNLRRISVGQGNCHLNCFILRALTQKRCMQARISSLRIHCHCALEFSRSTLLAIMMHPQLLLMMAILVFELGFHHLSFQLEIGHSLVTTGKQFAI